MTAIDTIKTIQTALHVEPDGDFRNNSRRALESLLSANPGAEWPSAAPAAFSGLTDAIRAEYQRLYDTMVMRWADDHKDEPGLEAIYQGLKAEFDVVVRSIRSYRARYEGIARQVGGAIPWWFIALIHNMECGLSFNKHLHNGDPLTARTKLVPAGRPAAGSPPFTFEESAVDALTMPGKAYDKVTDWTIPAVLYRLESFNGLGYLKYHPNVKSPYLWSGSNHYTRGKYVADGQWSESAVSKQLGTALLMKAVA